MQVFVLTTGRFKSPKTCHKSDIVIRPTNITTKRPTNLTELQQANIVPVKNNQNHQVFENSGILFDETFTAPNTEPIKNASKRGSKSIYWFKVIKPTSAKLNIC